MPTTLTGAFGKTLENAETLLANCAGFQTWTGEVDAAGARSHIGMFSELIGNWDRPACLLFFEEGTIQRASTISNGVEYEPWIRGGIVFRFEAALPNDFDDDVKEAFKAFFETVEGIVGEMQALSGVNEYLVVKAWEPEEPYPMYGDDKRGDADTIFRWEWKAAL